MKYPMDSRMLRLLRSGETYSRYRYGLGGVRKGRHINTPKKTITLPKLTCQREPLDSGKK